MTESNWRHFDFLLLGAVAVLTIFGIAMIRSTVAGNIELTEANLPQRQLIFAVAGFVVIFIVSAIDYHLWSSISWTMYTITVVFLAILTIVGAAMFGSARWFDTGIILIQPSEIAKIVAILTLAAYLSRHREGLAQLNTVLVSLLLNNGIVLWILIQPNMSTSIVIEVIWFAITWAAGLRWKHMLALAGIGLSIVALAIPLFPVLVNLKIINDYQLDRIENFVNPDEDAQYGETYNIEQAVISIGSGGLFGQGYGYGTQIQLRFLKVRWSDFIFASMSQEFGFIGTTLVMLLELFVVYRCLRAARLARDTFGALICYGVATLLAFQGMVNIGVNLRLLPATGLPLPFISYGGSSLLSLLLGIGLVESVILRHKSLEF